MDDGNYRGYGLHLSSFIRTAACSNEYMLDVKTKVWFMMCNTIYSNNISVLMINKRWWNNPLIFSVITSFGDHQRLVCEKQDLNHLVVLCWLAVSF